MRPGPALLEKLATALDAVLAGSTVDRVWRPDAWMVLFDVHGGEAKSLGKARVLIDADARHPRVVLTTRWPETPKTPDRETLILRKLLEGIRIRGVDAEADRRLVFRFAPRHDHELRLVVTLAGRYPNVAVLDATGHEHVRLVHDRPGVDEAAPPLPSGPAHDDPHADHIGRAWLEVYAATTWADVDRRARDTERAGLLKLVRGALAKVRGMAARHEADLARAGEAEALRHRGELLKTVLGKVTPKATSVRAVDWADPEQAEIDLPLDPELSAVANMEKLFARYRKLVRTQAEAEQRLEAAWEREAALTPIEAALLADEHATATAAEPLDLAAMAQALRVLGVRPSTQAPPRTRDDDERLPYRRFAAADGSAILVGRSAKDNDALTFRVASGRDVWLHARDVPGSHVVLVTGGGKAPSHEALTDAATLAAWHSSARGEAVVDVTWTERKHVRRVPGAAPGRVTMASARTLSVRVDPARIERLYAGMKDGA